MLGGRGGVGGGVTCHKCGKEGHIVRNCPALNNPDFKKDPMKVSIQHTHRDNKSRAVIGARSSRGAVRRCSVY
jgi:hypothetical protein